jgi:hypothetical protein
MASEIRAKCESTGVLARDTPEALPGQIKYEEVLLRERVTCVGYH